MVWVGDNADDVKVREEDIWYGQLRRRIDERRAGAK